MSWRDRLHLDGSGSFRGVEFFVRSARSQVGRRVVVHEFPGRDKPFVEDKGLGTRRFSFEAFVIGEDYDVQRDRLREAFEAPGPAELVHPYWGKLRVSLDGIVDIHETQDEGGMARFTVPVVEAGDELASIIVVDDTGDQLLARALAAHQAAVEAFAEAFSVVGAAQFVRDAVANRINQVASAVASVRGQINAAANAIDDIGASIDQLESEVALLTAAPELLGNAITDIQRKVFGAIATLGSSRDPSVIAAIATSPVFLPSQSAPTLLARTWRQLDSFGADFHAVPETTSQRRLEAENQRQLVRLVRTSAAAAACEVIATIAFEDHTQATELRDALYAALEELDGEADDTLYVALVDLRAAMVRHITTTSAELPRLIDYTPIETMPALVLAHLLYGDSDREQELVLRNRSIRHPGFVPGGTTLQVLYAT